MFYVCRTGRHTSLLAASFHLGKIRHQEDTRQIYNISGYAEDKPEEIGKPYLVGVDGQNAEIYTIGLTGEHQLMVRAAGDLIDIMGVSRREWQILDTSKVSSNWTIIGQMARRIHLSTLSKVLFYLGARNELPRLKTMVDHVRRNVDSM